MYLFVIYTNYFKIHFLKTVILNTSFSKKKKKENSYKQNCVEIPFDP